MQLFVDTRPIREPRFLVLLATALTVAAVAFFKWAAFTDAALFQRLVNKDDFGGGVVEHGTVLVLLPGIAAGLFAVLRHWRDLPAPWVGAWVLGWTLACIYFAGEEISWGQWQMGWETPELLRDLNDQKETNLHNISSWLDQKPRAVVETFIVVMGLLVPAGLRLARIRMGGSLCKMLQWLVAPSYCWAAAAAFLLVRLYSFIDHPTLLRMADSELRELAIAWFLALYLFSYPLRLAAHHVPAEAGSGAA